ncbi:MAG: NAD(P)/FAD-dependent oxidoreductase [Sphingobium sp.]|nr:MAG: NAD(P)/FAD-dependent oxidoreductase [Sphingobium sp.]
MAESAESKAKEIEFDPVALREKYREERDKRMNTQNSRSYVKLRGQFEKLYEDPNAEPGFTRDPVTKEVDLVIVGGGYGGLLSGAEARRAGVEKICMIERGADIGGTWYWNQYPGAACDVESYIYLPLLEEIGGMPKTKYATAKEIHEHTQKIARKFDLYDGALLQTVATEIFWNEETEKWVVRTDRGDEVTGRYLLTCTGPMTEPKLPSIPGIETFKGHTFHTSRWDYAYTGGDITGGLTKLADKKVAIVGTGATAIQVVPHLGRDAKHLYVVQRTPSSIHYRGDRATDPEWAASLKPGWQKERMENFTTAFHGGKVEVDMVNDEWTQSFFNAADADASGEFTPAQLANFRKMEYARMRVEEIVHDHDTAEGLKAWYNFFCKRPCFHDEYLPTFNRDNVTLVDTQGAGVERIDETGFWVGDQHYEVDCIVFSTGFEVGTSHKSRAGFSLRGRGGVTLDEHWSDGVRTMHGIFIHGFPNYFYMGGLEQAARTANFAHTLTEQSKHIGYIFKKLSGNCTNTLEATEEGEQTWVDRIIYIATENKIGSQNTRFQEECTPGYYNNEGQPKRVAVQNGAYGLGPMAYFAELREWREEGEHKGLSVEPAHKAN